MQIFFRHPSTYILVCLLAQEKNQGDKKKEGREEDFIM